MHVNRTTETPIGILIADNSAREKYAWKQKPLLALGKQSLAAKDRFYKMLTAYCCRQRE